MVVNDLLLKIAEHVLKEMGFSNARNCLGYRLIVKNIERTGDHAAFIAKDLLEFKKSIKKEIFIKLQEMNDFSLMVLDESCLALFKEDYYQAEKTNHQYLNFQVHLKLIQLFLHHLKKMKRYTELED